MKLHRITRNALAATLVVGSTAGLVATGAQPAHTSVGLTTPILLVHGFDGGGIFEGDLPLDSAVNCNNSVIKAWKAGLRARGFTRVFTVGWYKGDSNCDLNVPNRSTITINTSITTVAKRLTNLISDSFGTSNVGISAHSLGGLVARRAIQGVQHADTGFSSDIHVSDVVASGSPHAGASPSKICGVVNLFTQCSQAAPGSSYLADLDNNPQAVGGTDWTLIGSECDTTVSASSATSMTRVSTSRPKVAKVVFTAPGFFDGGCLLGSAAVDHAQLVTKSSPLTAIRTGLTTAN